MKKRGSLTTDGGGLRGRALLDLQRRCAGVDYILVDEMSMIGQDLLGFMSSRGKEAVRGREERDGTDGRHLGLFGGLNLILVGDPMQLPPVGAAPMWAAESSGAHAPEGRNVWLGLNAAVELTEVMRQLGPEQAAFRDALLAVAEGRATRVHYDLFKTRMRSQLSDTELDSFLDAVHLSPTNQKADDHNWTRLRGLGSPIALVKAEHTVAGSTNVSADRFRNLEPHLYLAVGARVFINSNVWTSAGLANGAVGEIMHISWELDDGLPGRRPPNVPVLSSTSN